MTKRVQPERIQGAQYTVKSDVWSLGISLIELALGRFPFAESSSDDSDLSDFEGTLSPSRPNPLNTLTKAQKDKKKKRKSKGVSLQGGGMTMSILELLQHIVNEPAPRLTPEGRFPKDAEDFVDSCLLKDPDARKTPKELLVRSARVTYLPCVLMLVLPRNTHGSSTRGRQPSTSRLGPRPSSLHRHLPHIATHGAAVPRVNLSPLCTPSNNSLQYTAPTMIVHVYTRPTLTSS